MLPFISCKTLNYTLYESVPTYFQVFVHLKDFTSVGPSLLKFSFLIDTLKIYNQMRMLPISLVFSVCDWVILIWLESIFQ